MNNIHTPLFSYDFQAAARIDIGRKRTSNQDEVIACPEFGFYAVSDGMGGLPYGGTTSETIRKVLPLMVENSISEYEQNPASDHAAQLLQKQVQLLSDNIFDTGNNEHHIYYGATLSGVWLIDKYAIFVNLGDSRAYLLPQRKKNIWQVTCDHNMAAKLVKLGKISKQEARNHPSSSSLIQFMGMPAPAMPDVFIHEVKPGDRLLICSDGLHGMVEDDQLSQLMRSSHNDPDKICLSMIEEANANGGRDNISVVYVKIMK